VVARTLIAALAFAAIPAWANYAQCLIENLANSKSATVHAAAVNLCKSQNPDGFYVIKRGAGRGLLGPKSPEACTIERAKNASWQASAVMIRHACGCLYGQPASDLDMCERYQMPDGVQGQHAPIRSPSQQIALEHHYRRIYAAHPDADAIFASRDFMAWASQTAERKAALLGGKTGDIIDLFSAYKAQLPDWERGVISPPPSR
jgi:hypothetical protein